MIDKIEVTPSGFIQIRENNSGKFHRYVLNPGQDITDQPSEVKEIANQVWTQEIIETYQSKFILTLEQQKRIDIDNLMSNQLAVQQAGFTCSNGIKLQVEDDDLINWTQLMAGITAFSPETVVIRDYNNINHTVTSTEATQMMQEVFGWGQWLFQDTWAKKDAIINGN